MRGIIHNIDKVVIDNSHRRRRKQILVTSSYFNTQLLVNWRRDLNLYTLIHYLVLWVLELFLFLSFTLSLSKFYFYPFIQPLFSFCFKSGFVTFIKSSELFFKLLGLFLALLPFLFFVLLLSLLKINLYCIYFIFFAK